MIINTASPKYFAPVALKILSEDGALQELTFDAQFKRSKQSEVTAFFEGRSGEVINHKETVDNFMTGWRGVTDPGAALVPYSPEALDALCEEYPGMRGAIAAAYYASITPSVAAHLAAKN
jgi:hypothetical protein